MKTSSNGIALIKSFESLKLTAYRCAAGVPTIGYGHTGADVTAADVSGKKTITEVQAEALLKKDLEKFEKGVSDLTKGVALNQNQFDALVSFAFNVGIGSDTTGLKGSTLLKKLRVNPNDKAIAAEFALWNKAKGVVLNGLTARRKAEAELYFKN